MKTLHRKSFMISAVLLLFILIIAMTTFSAKLKSSISGNESASLAANKQFVCSMHPEVIKDEPGDCPICGMSLIEKIDQSALISKKQYVCSMHPEVIKDEPGDCPICEMSLIIKIDQDMNIADSMLMDVVLPVNESVLGSVATVSPFRAEFPVIIEASGIINYDSRKTRTISARFGGLIEKSFVKYQFQPIRKGQKIYQIYCPDIYAEKWSYVKLIQAYPDRDDLTVEAREWLRNLGLTNEQIENLKRSAQPDYHLFVYSNTDGYAVNVDFDPENYAGSAQATIGGLGFNDGVTIETGSPLFKLVDIKSLRADLKVRTVDVVLLRKGQKVSFTVSGSKSKKMEANISQIEPLNGGVFQLVKVYFNDNEGLMLPGTQIQAQIMAGNHEAMWLPVSAIVNLGKQQTVFEMQGAKFTPATINAGLRFGDYIEILSGIDQDSKIAINASLLTDSDGFIHANSQ